MTELISRSHNGHIARVTLNRPEKYNAITSGMLAELREALDAAENDPAIRVVLLTGKGKVFSSGQDLFAFTPGETDLGDVLEKDYGPLITTLVEFPKVTVAALNGPAFGAGANLALACDIVVAQESSYLQQTFVKIGLVADVGGTWLLPRIVGLKRALALTLTGDDVSAREAQAMGLIYRVFPDADFDAEVDVLAERLAGFSPTACRLIKKGLRDSLEHDLSKQLSIEAELQREAGWSQEFRDAMQAFRSKRSSHRDS